MKFIWMMLLFSFTAAAVVDSEGVLVHEYGDGLNGEYITRYYLQVGDEMMPLSLSREFLKKQPIHRWLGSKVQVFSDQGLEKNKNNPIMAVKLIEGANPVSGSQPWISLLCRFSDNSDEPKNLSYFNGMYANQPAGLDHYWREVSYSNINVVGSVAVDWVSLPSPRSTYVTIDNKGDEDADLSLLFDDCVGAVDAFVDFSDAGNGQSFQGINMMFNDSLDCCAWGGSRWRTLDGVQKSWRSTWNPPWSYANEGVIAHEMGHGFGLPHANNSDGDDNPYDSPWDVMSAATGYGVNHNTYGRLGKHINMYFKHALGWVTDANDGFVADSQSDDVFLLRYTAHQAQTGIKFVRIPLSDGTEYFVETRKTVGDYESNLPGTAVIIHHVSECRNQPPWVVDADDPPADYADTEGVMWKTGETFIDPIDGFEVHVLNEFTNGFNVRIKASSDLIRRNGFEATCF